MPQRPKRQARRRKVRFQADRVDRYGSDADEVTATGNVVLRRGEQTVRADSRDMGPQDRGRSKPPATSASSMIAGNVLYTDKVELTDTLKAGAIEDMLLVLRQGGRLAAKRGERGERRSRAP